MRGRWRDRWSRGAGLGVDGVAGPENSITGASEGGPDGVGLKGPGAKVGAVDAPLAGAGGAVGAAVSAVDAPLSGAGGAVDAPLSGAVGAVDAALSGTGGAVDAPFAGTAGAGATAAPFGMVTERADSAAINSAADGPPTRSAATSAAWRAASSAASSRWRLDARGPSVGGSGGSGARELPRASSR